MLKFSETNDADIEYLRSAIIRDALTEKFRNLFGLDPVAVDVSEPMKIAEAPVPEMLLSSLDSNISSLLKASAVENSKNISGNVPDISGNTLVYTVIDDSPADVSLEAVEEYVVMDDASRDVTVSAVSESAVDINIEEGMAYVSGDLSNIEIGIFVDNKGFAMEFSKRIENSGGDDIDYDKKVDIFNELYDELPGGANNHVEGLRNSLLKVVGLTKELPASEQDEVPEELKENKNPAPGPEAVVEKPNEQKASSKEIQYLDEAVIGDGSMIGKGSIVVNLNNPKSVYKVSSISRSDGEDIKVLIANSSTLELELVFCSELNTY